MDIAFNYNITEVLASASFEMVECFRQFDPFSASQFLALHQVMQLMYCASYKYKKGGFSYISKNVYSYSLKIGHTEHNVWIRKRTSE